MLEVTGVRSIASEPGQRDWNPQLGLWRLEGARRAGPAVQALAPATASLLQHEATPLPSASVLWRGPVRPGDSLGNLTYASLQALLELGLEGALCFAPLARSPVAPASSDVGAMAHGVAALRRSLAGALCRLAMEKLAAPMRPALEIQVPGTARAVLRSCVRLVYSEFGQFPTKRVRPADVLWVPSRFIAARAREAFPLNPLIVVPHGVDLDTFTPEGDRASELAPDVFRFLYVGTTISRKGFDLVLDAFADLRERMPDAELVLKLQPTWQGFLRAPDASLRGVRTITQQLGSREMARLFRSCDVLVAPSRAEAFNLPVLEAMACGLPAIVSNGNGMDDFCPEDARYSVSSDEVSLPWRGSTRVRFLEPDPVSLRNALWLAYADGELRARKSEVAARAARPFAWRNVVKLLLAEALTAARRRGA